jgi:pimeloyl-ACP methyl ester carboxylesterase
VEVEGTWVHTAEWGPADGPVLLAVHGLGGSTVNWEPVGAGLAAATGRRVVAIDLPGFGRTRTATFAAAFEEYLRLLRVFAARLGPVLVAGNSMGGALSVALAAREPARVDGVVLVNAAFPRPFGNVEQLARSARFAALLAPRVATPIVRARLALRPETLVDATLRAVMAHPRRLDPRVRERLVALADERRRVPEAAAAYAGAGGTLFRYLVAEMRRDLAMVRAPTLVLHGRRDRLVPVSFARAAVARRRDWRLVELASCGHVPMLERPAETVAAVRRWWDEVASARSGPGAGDGRAGGSDEPERPHLVPL